MGKAAVQPEDSIISSCPSCGLLQEIVDVPFGAGAKCARCRTLLWVNHRNSVHRTAALALAGLIFYLPANVYPVLRLEFMGRVREATIWEGVVALMNEGSWFVALVVFVASIVFPLLKLMGLFFLVMTARWEGWRLERLRLYRFLEFIGPWAMLDVFLLALLVSLIRVERLGTILPGFGITAFAAVVILTVLATSSFDPRLIWQRSEERE